MGNMRFKEGDRVQIKSLDWYNENKTIHGDIWFNNAVFVGGQSLYCGCELTIRLVTNDSYYVIENDYYWTDEMIEGLVEEEEIEFTEEDKYWCDIMSESDPTTYVLPQGYQFKDENGNVINAQKIVLEKKKKEYPKTFRKCCEMLDIDSGCLLASYDIGIWKDELLSSLQKLLICRDAYWKIAGEEMGLGKPWDSKYGCGEWGYWIGYDINANKIYCQDSRILVNHLLVFPTAEMRDAFYMNFESEIEICKELL